MKNSSISLRSRKVVKIHSILLLVVSLVLISAGIEAEAAGISIGPDAGVVIVIPDDPNPCIEKPVFQNISADKDNVLARNNKMIPVNFSGKIDFPEGCPILVTYQMDDSYGEMSNDEPVQIETGADGSFTVEIKMDASREGCNKDGIKDARKDGRTYTITFEAKSEGESVTTTETWTVTHDSRK